MVAFCAMCTIQSIHHSPYDSDWSLFRIATLQELVAELEKQAAQRHPCRDKGSRSVVDAMAKQLDRAISRVLARPRREAMIMNDLLNLDDLFPVQQNPFDMQIPLFDDYSNLFGVAPPLPDGLMGMPGSGQGGSYNAGHTWM